MTLRIQRSNYVPILSELNGAAEFSCGVAYIGLGCAVDVISCFERIISGSSNRRVSTSVAATLLLADGTIKILNNLDLAARGLAIVYIVNKFYLTLMRDS